jgi:MFS family permease
MAYKLIGDGSQEPSPFCPSREALRGYARGERNPGLAGHIAECDSCAWFVTEAMEAEPVAFIDDAIDGATDVEMRYAHQDMSTTAAVPVDRHAAYNKGRIFLVSVLALFTAGVAASLRADVASELQRTFFDPVDKAHSAEMIGSVLGVPFLGFAFTIAIGSPLLDLIGAAILLPLSGVCFILGTLVILFASSLASGAGIFNVIWTGAVITGIGWGLVETVVNPLTVTIYSDDKTARLNILHAWWPGGLIAGGLLGYGLGAAGVAWNIKLMFILIPAALVVVLCLGLKFPPTERVASGISMGSMFKELLKPMFLLLFCCMFLTAASELAPGQWVDLALTRTVHMQGILLLVYVSGIMFVARHFAGPLVHKLSAIGLLWVSCLLASLGLVALSVANSPVTGILAATVWGCGVCFMWPTMLATASDRFPRGGALLMGLMGTAGTLSINFVLPIMGKIYDNSKVALGEGGAAQVSFRAVAVLPAVLLLVFGAIWLYDRSKGGFKSVKI